MSRTGEISEAGIVLTAELAQRMVDGDYTAFEWDDVVTIDPESARIITAFSGGLRFARVRRLSNEVALALSASDYISLPAISTLEGLSDEALAALGGTTGYRALDGVKSITPKQLRLLTAGDGGLSLDGLSTLTDELFDILRTHTGSLSLGGLRSLSASHAECLVGGPLSGSTSTKRPSLRLDGLTIIDEETAAILGAAGIAHLQLNGVKAISPRVAAHLARTVGRADGSLALLELGGLVEVSPAVATALAGRIGGLKLGGMATLSPQAAEALAQHRGDLLLFSIDGEETRRSLSAETYRALLPHRGFISLEAITAPALSVHAQILAGRAVNSDRNDGTSESDLVCLGEEGEFSVGPGWGASLPIAEIPSSQTVEIPANLLALAHHLQVGSTTSITLRELLEWFDAKRRGNKILDRIAGILAQLQSNGFDAVGQMEEVLAAEDLDVVHAFPPETRNKSALADAIRGPMTRLGYHLISSDENRARFQSMFATGRRRMPVIEAISEELVILRASVAIRIPDDAATLALAVTTANRMNRLSFVGRFCADPVARTLTYDVAGAVQALADLQTADGPDGVLPRLLAYVEAADLMMHRLLLDQPVHDAPEREIESIDLADAASERDDIMVSGASLRAAKTIDLGRRPFKLDEDNEEPPQVEPELVGAVMRANVESRCAKVYLSRDVQEMESVIVEMAVIVTDTTAISPVADWLIRESEQAETRVRTRLISSGTTLPQRIDSVDEILASLEDSRDKEPHEEHDDLTDALS